MDMYHDKRVTGKSGSDRTWFFYEFLFLNIFQKVVYFVGNDEKNLHIGNYFSG